MKAKRRRRALKPFRRLTQTRRAQSRPGSTIMRKKWPILLAEAKRRYAFRIGVSLDPEILYVSWRGPPMRRFRLSEPRLGALRCEVERRGRAGGLIK